jgi:DNA-binding transcriptional regulator LsrR (DeoR family)
VDSTDDLRSHDVVLLVAGIEKVQATIGLLRSGIVKGSITDGDIAVRLAA